MDHVMITTPTEHHGGISELIADQEGLSDRSSTFSSPSSIFEFDIDDATVIERWPLAKYPGTKIQSTPIT